MGLFAFLLRIRTLPILRGLWLARLRAANEAPDRRPTEVEPGVYVGGIATRARWLSLRAVGVTHALSLLAEAPPDAWIVDAAAVLWLPVPDRHPPTQEQLCAGCAFLDGARAQGSGVFIYCGSGMGRAPTMYMAWRAKVNGLDLAAALSGVQKTRRIAGPTLTQREALERWVNDVR